MNLDHPLLLLGAGFLVALSVWMVSHHFSRDAKLGRRRRRNNSRVEPKVKRPMVRLSVRTRKKK